MAQSAFDGWTDGDLNNPFIGSGLTDWDAFYKSVGTPRNYSLPAGMDDTGLPTSKITFEALTKFRESATSLVRGERDVVLPNGETIKSTGSAAIDFMRGVFGVSPLDDTAKTTKGDPVAPGTGGILEPAGALFVQVALIAIGAVIIFVALWMLLSPTLKGK